MKILFTGKTDFKYNRVRVLLAGLDEIEDVEVIFFPIKNRKSFNKQAFIELQNKVDFIYIPPFRHRDVRFIKKISTKPVVFDPLISKYLTKAIDYKHYWKAPIKYFLDKIPFSKCDILIADTLEHKRYFINKFKIGAKKIAVLPIGVDISQFHKLAQKAKSDQLFHIGFYGTFVPLQGIPKIIEVANRLKENTTIVFDIIGSGYDYKKSLNLIKKYNLKNVTMLGWKNYDDLNSLLNKFDVCLGIFGDSLKADSVVPNKVFHYASMGKCIISKDTPGINEIFTHNENIILCDNSAEKIAEQILLLSENRSKIIEIGKNASELITKQYNHIEIAKRFIAILNNYKSDK